MNKMNCAQIEEILSELKTDSLGRIRNKGRVIDKIHAQNLKDIDNALMDVRLFVAKISTGHSTSDALKIIDDFIYKKQL